MILNFIIIFKVKYKTLNMYLSVFYDILKPDIESGYFTRIPITKKGFIKGFYNKIIDKQTFDAHINKYPDGEFLDEKLNLMTKYKQFLDFNTLELI